MDKMDKMELVLMAIEDEDGVFAREPGFVLADLSFITGIEYKQLSATVLEMEALGLVVVDRYSRREPERANKLTSIRIKT